MKKILVIVLIGVALGSYSIATADTDMSEPELIVNSWLSGDTKNASSENGPADKNLLSFNDDVKEIAYSVTIDNGKHKDFSIQSVRWYSPDGKVWLEETRNISQYLSNRKPKSAPIDVFYLNRKDMPSEPNGVWAIISTIDNKKVDEKYYYYGQNAASPTKEQIDSLKEKINKFNQAIVESNKSFPGKLASYLSIESKGDYDRQKIIGQDFSFLPKDTIVYTLNIDIDSIHAFNMPMESVIVYSPSGKIYKEYKQSVWHSFVYGQLGILKQTINLEKMLGDDYKENKLLGLWKIDVYSPEISAPLDQRFFYIDEIKRNKISSDDMKPLVLSEEGIVSREKIAILTNIEKGSDEERILSERGSPTTILRTKSGNQVWIYWRENEWSKTSSVSNSMDRSRAATNNSNIGAGIATAIIGSVFDGLTNVPTGDITKIYFIGNKIEEVVERSHVYITDIR